MDANTTTPLTDEENTPELISEEEELSSGNRKLALIAGAILALVILGYVLLPAQTTRRIVNAMPVMELGEATVTASRPTEEAAAVAATPAAAAKATATVAAPAAKSPAAKEEARLNTATEEEASVEPAAAEAEPVAAAPVVEAAPTTVTMAGRILDENGRPLAGATVMLKGGGKVTGTDANGNYSLEVPAGDNTLVYGYGGYEDQEVRTRGTQAQNVTLLPKEGVSRRRRR